MGIIFILNSKIKSDRMSQERGFDEDYGFYFFDIKLLGGFELRENN